MGFHYGHVVTQPAPNELGAQKLETIGLSTFAGDFGHWRCAAALSAGLENIHESIEIPPGNPGGHQLGAQLIVTLSANTRRLVPSVWLAVPFSKQVAVQVFPGNGFGGLNAQGMHLKVFECVRS